jgi:hypothetical protein
VDSLLTVTPVLVTGRKGRPHIAILRRALRDHTFVLEDRRPEPTAEIRAALKWLEDASLPMTDNYFIIKSLAMTRPGGMVAVLTRSFTMDAANPSARREMNSMADLAGAVRLPSGAHRHAAGTEALTDLLIFQRRPDGTEPRDETWETVTPRTVDGTVVLVNNYFEDHPEHVLGRPRVGTGMYGAETVSVVADDLTILTTVDGHLAIGLSDIVERARAAGQGFTEISAEDVLERAQAVQSATDLWDGTILAEGAEFRVAHNGSLEPLAVPKTQQVELRHLLRLRDGARAPGGRGRRRRGHRRARAATAR